VPEMGHRPLARSTDLIIEELGEELLIYDSTADRAHSLTPVAAKVWRSCDGNTSAPELSTKLGLDADVVARALDELSGCDLLEQPPTLAPVAEGSTRREVTIKAAKVGAAAAAAPLILSVAAPPAYAVATLEVCLSFSSGNCGKTGADGCSKSIGCCCCIPPITGTMPPAPHPCSDEEGNECKTCVPCPGTAGGATDPFDCRFYTFPAGGTTQQQCSAGDC
jgi:hypothetical protein